MKASLKPKEKLQFPELALVEIVVGASADGSQLTKINQEEDGFLFSANPLLAIEFILGLRVSRVVQAYVVSAFGQNKTIVPAEDKHPELPKACYQIKIQNREINVEVMEQESKRRLLSTKHSDNNVRLIVINEGMFQMWEIAIPTRIVNGEANFFLTMQKLYQGRMYNVGGEVYIPKNEYEGYDRWDSLQEFLNSVVDAKTLSAVIPITETVNAYTFAENTGRVAHFCLASGVGVAQTNHGPAKIHWSQIESHKRFSSLEEGQMIEFAEIIPIMDLKEGATVMFQLKGIKEVQ